MVLEDLFQEGKLSYIKNMAIEYHHHTVEDEDKLSKIFKLLEDAGFGYQIEGVLKRPFKDRRFQDILIYAYQKDGTSGTRQRV